MSTRTDSPQGWSQLQKNEKELRRQCTIVWYGIVSYCMVRIARSSVHVVDGVGNERERCGEPEENSMLHR